MIDLALQIATATACLIVMVRTEPALNAMHGRTDFWVRLSFWQMAVAATIELLSIIVYGYVPDWREAILAGGLAALLLCERRIRYLARLGGPKRVPQK